MRGPWGPDDDPEGQQTPQLRRYLAALHRHRWITLAVTLVGSAAGVVASRFVKPQYKTQATLWVEVSDSKSDRGPIQQGELLDQSSAWIELLRSYVVLDSVVAQEHLYVLTERPEDRAAFGDFSLATRFRPGKYKLQVSEDGGSFVLTSGGVAVENGRVGGPVGEKAGFRWTPSPRVLRPSRLLEFEVVNPRDASIELARQVSTELQKDGNFLRLALTGSDPKELTSTLNTLAERYVGVAAELKRAKLDQLTRVLNEQLRYAESNLASAELELQSFRVHTITLPSEKSTPLAPGLEITQNPVMDRYFSMKIDREQLRMDREAIERILRQASDSAGALDALSTVGAVQQSATLQSALTEYTEKRAALRALLEKYTPEYPPAQKLSASIHNLEQNSIPKLAGELRAQLMNQESALQSRIDQSSTDLREIPARSLEEARLERQVSTAENLHKMLKQRYEEARLAAASTIPDIRILDRAVEPYKPVSDQRLMAIALGVLGSLGLAVAGVIVADKLDPKVRYPEEVTTGMGLPILGAVPTVVQSGKKREAIAAGAAEAFREIRLNLVHSHGTAGPLVLTISSAGSGDGKSFTAANLALAFADQGYRTLVIDGDVRRGALHRSLGAKRTPGLTDLLTGKATQAEAIQTTGFSNIFFIGGGTRMTRGPELLASAAMGQLLLSLRSSFGAIIVDSAPLGAGVDAFALAAHTRNLLLVVRAGTTDRALATAKLAVLDRLPIRLLGAVMNGVPEGSSLYRYYSYLPGYEASEESASPEIGSTEEPMQLRGA